MSRTPNPKIVALGKEAQESDDSAILAIYLKIKKLGNADKLIYKRFAKPKNVSPHRSNRGGLMASGIDSITVLEVVDAVGFDPSMLHDATAFEEPPTRDNEMKWLEICASDELLADFKPGDIEIASVACTHFNQSIASTIDKRPWANESITFDGRLSQERLVAKYPDMEELFNVGLHWDVWKIEAEVMYPWLPDVAQRAINAKYAAQQTEGWQHMYQRAVMIINSPLAQKSPDISMYVIKDILKTRPKCADDVPFIVDMAMKWGGSSTKTFVEPLMRFVRSFMPKGRVIPGSMFKALGALKLEPDELAPHFINSILMFLAGSPPKTAPSNVAKAIIPSEISSLEKGVRLKGMLLGEVIIKEAYQVSGELGLPPKSETILVCDLRSALVAKVFEKVESLKAKSMYMMATDFFDKAKQHQTTSATIGNPWALKIGKASTQIDQQAGPASSSGVVGRTTLSYNEDGEAQDVFSLSLSSRGFVVDCFVKNKEGAVQNRPTVYTTHKNMCVRLQQQTHNQQTTNTHTTCVV